MKFDTVILGGGLAGLMCGISLARSKQNCVIISNGQSALHFSSGSFDLLNHLPDNSVVDHPISALSRLRELSPEHPYNMFSESQFTSLAEQAKRTLIDAGLSLYGSVEQNHYRVTPVGKLCRTWLSLADAASFSSLQQLNNERIVVVNIDGFLDFQSHIVAAQLKPFCAEISVENIQLPELDRLRLNPSEFRSVNIARVLEQPECLNALENALAHCQLQGDIILLPACIGLENFTLLPALSQRLNKKIYLVPTLPPSLLGMRIYTQLLHYYRSLGGQFIIGDVATSADIDNDRVTKIYTKNHTDIPFIADNFVLATGSFFSHGLVATHNTMFEPVFNVDMHYQQDRHLWFNTNFFAEHDYLHYGIKYDSSFRTQKNGKTLNNLYASGAILSGFDPLKQGCGAGVSLLTALAISQFITA